MATRFDNIWFIRNNGGTYEAWQDNETAATYSGTNLVTNVLNSIETAETGNFAVIFHAGTFDMGTDNWTLNAESDVLIAGAGMDSTIIQNSNSTANDTEPISITNCDRITVRDLTISAGGTARSTSDALDFDNCDECRVENVKVTASRARGIVFDGKDASAQAIGNVVRNCVVTGTQGTSGHGIELLAAERCEITGCHIYDTSGAGIHITKASNTAGRPNAQSLYNRVHHNICHNVGRDGVLITSSSYNIITGNHLLNGADDTASRDGVRIDTANAIQADANIINNNVIGDDQGTATQRYGVNVAPTAATEAADNIVTGNVFFTNLTAPINDTGTNTRFRDNVGAADNTAQEIDAAYTVLLDDAANVYNVTSTGAARTITLPDNADASGRAFIFRREGTNNVTVQRAGSDTLDGGTSKVLGADKSAIGIVSVGDGDWKLVSTEGTVT